MKMKKALRLAAALLTAVLLPALQSCNGILGDIYDQPVDDGAPTVSGRMYIDASSWTHWHYIDLQALADSVSRDSSFNTSSLWVSMPVPTDEKVAAADSREGIYTYWYDVYGVGISNFEFRSFYPTEAQECPAKWTLAVHRNNVRTNDCEAAPTKYSDINDVPSERDFLASLEFKADEWNETDVWTIQDHMLSGLIGNQGIAVNPVLSSWLSVDIPPIPPAFTLNSQVFVLRLPDGTYGALQLADYQSSTGQKCCLTINYRYPL